MYILNNKGLLRLILFGNFTPKFMTLRQISRRRILSFRTLIIRTFAHIIKFLEIQGLTSVSSLINYSFIDIQRFNNSDYLARKFLVFYKRFANFIIELGSISRIMLFSLTIHVDCGRINNVNILITDRQFFIFCEKKIKKLYSLQYILYIRIYIYFFV